MNDFLKQIKLNIYSPKFYKEILSYKISYSLKYFFVLITILSLIVTIIFSFKLIPEINYFLKSFTFGILNYYPKDLVINISQGKIETNVQTPYFISWPKEFEKPFLDINNFLVIDTDNQFSLEKFKEYKTLILLTRRNIIYLANNEIIIKEINPSINLVIDQNLISLLVSKINFFKKFLGPIVAIFIFLGFLIIHTLKLIYLFIPALFIMIILNVFKIKLNYLKCYQIGIHAMTLPLLLSTLLSIFNFKSELLFAFTTLLLIVVIINFKNNIFKSNQNSLSFSD